MTSIFVTRIFSGLFETIKSGQWNPTGIPAFVRLAERCAKEGPVQWLLICKTQEESALVEHRTRRMEFGNGISFIVFPFHKLTRIGQLDELLNDILVLPKLLRLVRHNKNTFLYCDRSNICFAAIFKLFLRRKVVVRILGIYPGQKALVDSRSYRILHWLTYLAYKVRYDLAVCTQDGSGVEHYLNLLLNRKTKKAILLNGNDLAMTKVQGVDLKRTPDQPVKLLFVGTLAQSKGILDFVEALKLLHQKDVRFTATIVGKGPLFDQLKEFLRAHHLADFVQMAGAVSLEDVKKYYIESDIYVSLNQLGNLSNTVLDAMNAGKCIVMLGKDRVTHSDEITEQLVPEDAAVRVDRSNLMIGLVEKLQHLIEHPELIQRYSMRMREFSPTFLWSWDKRIEYELGLLKRLSTDH